MIIPLGLSWEMSLLKEKESSRKEGVEPHLCAKQKFLFFFKTRANHKRPRTNQNKSREKQRKTKENTQKNLGKTYDFPNL